MAATTMMSSQLRLIFHDGDDLETGEPIFKTKNFNHVKTNATADQLFEVAQVLASLQELPLYSIERRDNSEITSG